MPRFTPKRHEQLLTLAIAKVVTNTELSDVGDSSSFKHVLAAAARGDDEQYYQMVLLLQLFSIDSARGDDLDARAAEIQPATITRRQAEKATGLVVFSRAGTTGTVAIPQGTKVKTASNVIFTTTAPGEITPTSPEQIGGHGVGRDSAPVPVLADLPGTDGNAAAGTVIKFVSKPANIEEVVNQAGFVTGVDKESDDSFRAKLRAFIRSLARCQPEAIEVGVVGQSLATGETIRFAHVWEDPVNRGNFILYIDDGTGSAETTAQITGENVCLGLAGPPPDSAVGGEEYLYLNQKPVKTAGVSFTLSSSTRGALTQGVDYDLVAPWGLLLFTPALVNGEVITATYTYYTGLIQLAQKIIDGDPNDRASYPGLRAAGVLGTVDIPQVQVQVINAIISVSEGYDQGEVLTAVREAIKDYINGLTISGDVIRAEIIKRIMSVTGVYNVSLNLPIGDVAILDDQLARTTDPNITLT